jgi:tRNA(adenine34) deaminase
MWETLSEPWRACVDLAWEAYRADSLPIGAVVADTEGRVLAGGRNRIYERSGPGDVVFGHNLAHAELNALLSLDLDANDPRACVLYTTTEPCPLCAGAMRMTDVGELRYAAREPWAGSAAMFETVPYLRRSNVRVLGPEDGRLETVLVALQVERFLRLEPEILVLVALQGSHAGGDEGGEEGLSLGVAAGDEQGWSFNPGDGPSA